MDKTSSLPEPIQRLSSAQRILLVLAGLIIAFLILGSFGQNGNEGGLNVGIQTQPFIVLALLSFGGGILSFVSLAPSLY